MDVRDYDLDLDGYIETEELLEAIKDWLDGKITVEELLKVINAWTENKRVLYKVPEDFKRTEITSKDIFNSLLKTPLISGMGLADKKYLTVRPEELLNYIYDVDFSEYEEFDACVVAFGKWHLDYDLFARAAVFVAQTEDKRWVNLCFDGKDWWLIYPKEWKFEKLNKKIVFVRG